MTYRRIGRRATVCCSSTTTARAHAACSLRQVFDLLQLPELRWTRAHALAASNDVGYISSLKALGACFNEMESIRTADRRA